MFGTQTVEHRKEKKGNCFFLFYSDFTQFNHGYIDFMPYGIQCIYNLKNNENY